MDCSVGVTVSSAPWMNRTGRGLIQWITSSALKSNMLCAVSADTSICALLERCWRRCSAMGTTSKRGTIGALRSEEHTSELQSLMRISYAVFCLKKKKCTKKKKNNQTTHQH